MPKTKQGHHTLKKVLKKSVFIFGHKGNKIASIKTNITNYHQHIPTPLLITPITKNILTVKSYLL